MPPNTCSDAKKTRKQKHQTGKHLRSNNDALYNLELLRLDSKGRCCDQGISFIGDFSVRVREPSRSTLV